MPACRRAGGLWGAYLRRCGAGIAALSGCCHSLVTGTGPGFWCRSAGPPASLHRQSDGEYRAAAGVVAGVDAATVQACVLAGDRQAQAAAFGAGSGGVSLVEALEQVRDGLGSEPGTVVANLERHLLCSLGIQPGAGAHGD